MKIAIVADSNSGVTQDEAKELGIYCLLYTSPSPRD